MNATELPSSAKIVIVDRGIVGSSVAYHLARLSQLGLLRAGEAPENRGFGSKGLHYIRWLGPAMWPAAVMRGGGWGGKVRLSRSRRTRWSALGSV